MTFDQPETVIRDFLKQHLPQHVKLLTAESFAHLEKIEAHDDRDRQAKLLHAIRNRPQRNQLPWQNAGHLRLLIMKVGNRVSRLH